MFERALAVVFLAGAILVALALTGAFEPAKLAKQPILAQRARREVTRTRCGVHLTPNPLRS